MKYKAKNSENAIKLIREKMKPEIAIGSVLGGFLTSDAADRRLAMIQMRDTEMKNEKERR